MAVILFFSLCFGTLIGYYFYRYLRRSFVCFGLNLSQKKVKIPLLISALVIGAGCANIGSMGTLLFLHILFISLFTRFINYVFKKVVAGKFIRFNKYREKVFQSGILPVVISVVIVVAGYFNMFNIVKTEYTLTTQKPLKQNYKIALIADVHYGVSVGKDELTKKCTEISSQNPDIVVLAGDITDSDTTKKEMEEVFACLGKIKSNYGIFYVYGNHDKSMMQIKNKYTDTHLEDTIRKNGIVILEDSIQKINGEIALVGRADAFWGSKNARKPLAELLKETLADEYIINIDHQPKEYRESTYSGCDLVLSGHTHGGQIWPVDIIQKLFNINDGVYGIKKTGNNTHAIITSGFAGWSYPIKTSAPAEYVIINIKNSKSNYFCNII